MFIKRFIFIIAALTSFSVPLCTLANANPRIQITGKLAKVDILGPGMPRELIIQTKENELYFLSGRLVSRLYELFDKIKALSQAEVTLIGQMHSAKVNYRGKQYPLFAVEDYILPKIEGINLEEEETIKENLKIKSEQ